MKAFTALILISLVVSLLILISPIKAQEPLQLIIMPDGSVFPDTNLLERNGNKYTFKGDIFGTIWVQTDNIVIDGAEHTIQGHEITERRINLDGPEPSRPYFKYALVKNLRIYNGVIFTVGSSNNSFIGNYFDHSSLEIVGFANYTGNLIKYNTFRNASIFYDYNKYGMDVITENNFIERARIFVGLAHAPIVDKNYWSNYTAKYPDAKELGSSGIWDTPYVGDPFDGKECIDYHPLVNPITDFEIADFSNHNSTPTPSLSTASPTPISGAQTISPALLWVVLIVLPVAILVVAIIFKRKSLFKKK